MLKAALITGFTLILVCANTASAQTNINNDYFIVSAGTSNLTEYINALDAANWETYRLQNHRCSLSFDNGFTIELKSASELIEAGYPLNILSYPIEKPQGYIPPILKLLPGNIIGMEIQSSGDSKYH